MSSRNAAPLTAADRLFFLNSTTVKAPCRVVTSGNVVLSGLQTIDGVVLAVGDRILVVLQTDTTENGIYAASHDSWTRTMDMSRTEDVVAGTTVLVTEGNRYTNSLFRLDPL